MTRAHRHRPRRRDPHRTHATPPPPPLTPTSPGRARTAGRNPPDGINAAGQPMGILTSSWGPPRGEPASACGTCPDSSRSDAVAFTT